MKALIFKNKVVQLAQQEFPVHSDMFWVDASEDITVGLTFKDNEFIDESPKEVLTYEQKRIQEYPSIDELIVALWERVVEKNSTLSDELQLKRQQIKNKYPKPE